MQPTKMVIWKMGYYYCFTNISRDICWGCNGAYNQIISTLNWRIPAIYLYYTIICEVIYLILIYIWEKHGIYGISWDTVGI